MLYRILKTMIARGQTDGMQEKLDALLALDRITLAQYTELVAMLPKEEEQDAQEAQESESEG